MIPTINIKRYFQPLVLILLFLGCCKDPNESKNEKLFEQSKIAIVNEDISLLKTYILSAPALISMRDRWDQSTLLHIACTSCLNDKIIQFLLEKNSDPNAKDDEGKTPLHCVYKYGAPESLVNLLIQAKAQTNICDVYGKRPIDYHVGLKNSSASEKRE